MTKLSDEACDLFKAMLKSQNKPGHKMTHFHGVCVCVSPEGSLAQMEARLCVCVCVCAQLSLP